MWKYLLVSLLVGLVAAASWGGGVGMKRDPFSNPDGDFCFVMDGFNSCSIVPQDWQVWTWEPRRAQDIPDAANDWVVTAVGACTTARATQGYPFFRVITSAADNDECNYVYSQTGGWPAFIHQVSRDFYYEVIFRVKQATGLNDADTVDEADFFLGIVVDGNNTILTGATDYLGVWKADQNVDATNNLYLVAGDFGGTVLGDQFKQSIGWTSTGAAIGDSSVPANREARLLGPGNWTQLSIYAENVQGPALSTDGLVHVRMNGIPVPGSPFQITDQMPDSLFMTPGFAIRNGEASLRHLDIARIVVARRMRTIDGHLSRYTDGP